MITAVAENLSAKIKCLLRVEFMLRYIMNCRLSLSTFLQGNVNNIVTFVYNIFENSINWYLIAFHFCVSNIISF